MRSLLGPLLILACPAWLPAQEGATSPKTNARLASVFDASALETSADPCVDFYQYACGTWLAKNPIPADRPEWARFDELEERNLAILRDILEKASVNNPNRTSIEQKIGDYYAACMDEATIEKEGIEPIQPELDHIASLTDKSGLAAEVARLHLNGVNVLFSFSSEQDFKNSNTMIARADQGGLGLPEREYYLKDDRKAVETRGKYIAHVAKMFELLGDSAERAAAKAQVVLRIETALARGSLDVVSRRDPVKVYHRTRREELALSLDPSFGWPQYLSAVTAPPSESLNVAVPEFFKGLDSLINMTSLEDWKTYLTWHLVHSQAPLLPAAFVQENFDFFGKFLTGAQELRPRWKRCVSFVDGDLGEALGQKYVDRAFGAEGKERTLRLVRAVETSLGKDVMALDWMSPATKQKAIEKLHSVTNKIGYPDKWRDYSAVKIARGDFIGNSERATEFEFRRQLDKIGRPVDHTEWQMTPPTVNAYYDPQMNDINFPAGILQPPMFDKNADEAVNFGAIGSVIGHELTHGFDDEGRQFDAKGNLRDWWNAQDTREFEKRAGCLVDEYSSFKAVDELKLNGKLTLGENTADYGGLRVAYMALMDAIADRSLPKIDDFTPAQRFFLGYAQSNCQNESDELLRLGAQTDPHSPPKFRVNGVVQNMPEFQKAFGCQLGQPMVRKTACRVW
jgi:endothelin-converting enzyme/putative endopeptidase